MGLHKKEYTLLAGNAVITDSALVNTSIIRVQREGIAYKRIIVGLTLGRVVKYQSFAGRLIFQNPASPSNERVTVIYNT